MQQQHHILRSALLTGLIFACGIAVTFSAQSAAGRALGASEFGVFSYTYAWITICSALSVLGYDMASLRFASHYYSAGKLDSVDGFYLHAARWVLATSLCFTLIIISLALIIDSINLTIIIIGALSIPFWAMTRLDSAILRGMQQELASLIPDRLIRDTTLLLVSIAAIKSYLDSYTAIDAVIAILAGSIIGYICALCLRKITRYRVGPFDTPTTDDSEIWLKVALGLWLVNSLEILFNRIDVLIIGTMLSSDNVGILAITLLISGLVLLPVLGFNVVFIPRISTLYTSDRYSELGRLSRLFGLLNSMCALIICIPVLLYPNQILGFIDESFVTPEAANALFWLTISRFLITPFGPVAPLLAMTGNHNLLVINYSIIGLLKVIGLFLLVPELGLTGAVYISAITFFILQVSASLLVRIRLGFFPGILNGI